MVVAQEESGPFQVDGTFSVAEQQFQVGARLGRLTEEATATLQLELATGRQRREAALETQCSPSYFGYLCA